MPEGLPAPERGTPVFEVEAQLGEIHGVGQTPYGNRRLLEIRGGDLQGPEIRAELRDGGLDFELTLDNGVVEVEQVMLLQTDDRDWLYLRSCGVAPDGEQPARVVFDFEAANGGRYAWLQDSRLVGTREVDAQAGILRLRVYDVGALGPEQTPPLQIEKPTGKPAQPWECSDASGRRGATAFTENVRIGGSGSVGAGKRGTRSAIPITGGSTQGRVQGSVLAGGADYQLRDGSGFTLDARYTLRTDDGELILVRNCGPASALVPRFETRADGPYAFLNEDAWLSSSPGLSIGAVNITIYERE